MSLRNSYFAVVCVLWLVPNASAQEISGAGAAQAPNTGVLLFRSGRALSGQISETETHYVVTRTGGKLEVLKSDVEFAASDFDAVYSYKRKSIDSRDVDGHIALAQWCIQVGLRTRAAEELDRAAALAPASSPTQRAIESLQRTLRAAEKTISLSPPVPTTPSRSQDSSPASDLHSYQQDVPGPLLSSFSVQIQPMLTRSCSIAGCHDSGHAGSFTLQRSPRPVAKLTQQNLRSVLAHIDNDEPDTSPILNYAVRPHGRSSASPLAKGAGDPAYLTLIEWVRSVSGKPSKPIEPEVTTAIARSDPTTNTITSNNAAKLSSPLAQAGALLDRDGNDIRAKLEELSGTVRVHSNKPIAATPSRIRAGMVQQPTGPMAAAAPPPTTLDVPSPLQPRTTAAPPAQKTDSAVGTLPRTQESMGTTASQGAKSQPSASPPATPFQPADPFDPEIFNRQFAPARK